MDEIESEKIMRAVVDSLTIPELLIMVALSSGRLAQLLADKPYLLEFVNMSAISMLKVAEHLKRAQET